MRIFDTSDKKPKLYDVLIVGAFVLAAVIVLYVVGKGRFVLPAALLLDEEPEAEKRLPPAVRAALPAIRRRARKRLAEPEAATVKAFGEKLHRSWAEPRDRRRRLA